jgi:TetR/AcrR family transcriptional regulator
MKKDKDMEKQVLTTAEALFLEKGYALTTTTEIAKRVGCNQALIHYYFRTKEKLFEAVFFKKIIVFISSFVQVDEKNISFEDKLKYKIEAHFDLLKKNQQLPFLIINEMITNPERIKFFKEKMSNNNTSVYKQFVEDLEVEIEAGRIRQISVIDIIFMILTLNISVFLMKPMLMEILGLDEKGFGEFAENRKKENVMTIMKSLKP